MTERVPIQYAAGSLAASAFVAATQILTGVTLDVPLYIALAAFAANIPFQIILFFMPVPQVRTRRLSWPQKAYFSIQLFRHLPSSLVSLRCSGISHGGSESCLLWQLGPHTKYTATVPFRRLMMSKILQKSPDRHRQWSNQTMQPTAVPAYCPASLYENTSIAIRARSSPAVANLGLVRPMQNKAIQK